MKRYISYRICSVFLFYFFIIILCSLNTVLALRTIIILDEIFIVGNEKDNNKKTYHLYSKMEILH